MDKAATSDVLDSWENYEDRKWCDMKEGPERGSMEELATLVLHDDVEVTQGGAKLDAQADIRKAALTRREVHRGPHVGGQRGTHRGGLQFPVNTHIYNKYVNHNNGVHLFNSAIDACAKQRDRSDARIVKRVTTTAVERDSIAFRTANNSFLRHPHADPMSRRPFDQSHRKPGRADEASSWRR